MTDKLKQIVKEEMTGLPKEMQNAINVFDWANISEEIGRKYILSEDEINNFQVETFLVLVGFEDLESYPRHIENEIGTSKEEAKNISEEARLKIFTPVYDILTANIRKSIQNKEVDWKQGLDFVLSGGDYSVFIQNSNPSSSSDMSDAVTQIPNSKIDDLKNKFSI